MNRLLCLALTVGVGLSAPIAALAQESAAPAGERQTALRGITPEKLAIARQIVRLSGSGTGFDELLPDVADQAKATFIRNNPQMQLGIIEIVDRVALQLVDRRRELDEKLAEVWSEAFTDEELEGILAFYQTPAGRRYTELLPRLLGAQVAVADAWAQAVGQEMVQIVSRELQQAVQSEAEGMTGGGAEGFELEAQ